MHHSGSLACVLLCMLLLTFLALPKPCSRASWCASSFVPSCSWTRKWSLKMSSSSAAAVMSTRALSRTRASAVPSRLNPSIVLLVSERSQTQRNAGALQQGSSGRISSVIGVCVWDPICMFCLPLIYKSSALLHVTFHGKMPNKLTRVWLIASLPPSVVCMK